MIFAAGLGSRLGDLTRDLPKALIPVAGVPMLERVARQLIDAGAARLIINTHHFADSIHRFVESRRGFGVEVAFSHEPDFPRETGGGLRRAAHLFRAEAPFFLHNVDVLSDLPLRRMYDDHLTHAPLATLATMERKTSRLLLFDDAGLYGRIDEGRGIRIEARSPVGATTPLAFAGVHVVAPEFLTMLPDEAVYSILDPYLDAATRGLHIRPFRVDDSDWIDIGKPEQLALAAQRFSTRESQQEA